MRGSVDRIKERLDILEVVGGYVKLEKAGANYKGKCPFHNEKTGSFFVSPGRNTYYCFGCGEKGDIFSFTEAMEGVDFRGALKILAKRAGVELVYEKPEVVSEKDKIYDSLETATNYYEEELAKNPEILKYLESRGLTSETIKLFRIGYSPEEWRGMVDYGKKTGFSTEILVKAGLVKYPSEESGGKTKDPYDVFRGRIMFPLNDAAGKVIAFSGRAIGDAMPKYLNSPDTILFTKSEVLYGLDKAKEDIRKKDFSVLVEGQLDLVLSHQAGVKNTVASSGTAFTRQHFERLQRLSQRIILAFDGDEAGAKASDKSALLGLSLGLDVKVAKLPVGKDPADLVMEDINVWKDVLRNAKHAIENRLQEILFREKDLRKVAKSVEKYVLPLVVLINSAMERSHFVSVIAKATGIREEVVWEDLKRVKIPDLRDLYGTENKSPDKVSDEKETPTRPPRKNYIERRIVGIIFWQKSLPEPSINLEALENDITAILGDSYLEKLLKSLESDKETLIFEAESYSKDKDKLTKDFRELVINLEDDSLREELTFAIRDLSVAERERNQERIDELGQQIAGIHKRMSVLEGKRKVM